MSEGYSYNPEQQDPYAPQFLPMEEHLDAFPDDSAIEQKQTVMSEWDLEYQKSITRITPDELLLSKEEEEQLALDVQEGQRAAIELQRYKESDPEYKALSEKADRGRVAKDELVVRNLRLASWFVRQTMDLNKKDRLKKGESGRRGAIVRDLSRLGGGHLEYADRMQLATLGLIRAADKYVPRGARFSSIAMYEMEHVLLEEIQKNTLPIRLPKNTVQDISKLKRSRQDLLLELGREPTYDELRDRTDFNPDYLRNLDKWAASRQPVSFEEISDRYSQQLPEVSIEDDASSGIPDVLPDTGVDLTIEDEVVFNDLGRIIDDIIEGLDERERFVILFRFGLDDGTQRTLEEVGQIFGVTRERIRQIEARALSKLRGSKKMGKIVREYFDGDQSDPVMGIKDQIPVSDYDEAQLDLDRAPVSTIKNERPVGYESGGSSVNPAANRTYTLAEYNRMKEEQRTFIDGLDTIDKVARSKMEREAMMRRQRNAELGLE